MIKRYAPLKRSSKQIERRVRPRRVRKGPKGSADIAILSLLSRAVRLRDPRCRVCPITPGGCKHRPRPTTDAMHMRGRSQRRVRWDLDNVLGGCRPCHDYWTAHGKAWQSKWREIMGPEHEEMLERRATNLQTKPDADAARARLTAYINGIEK